MTAAFQSPPFCKRRAPVFTATGKHPCRTAFGTGPCAWDRRVIGASGGARKGRGAHAPRRERAGRSGTQPRPLLPIFRLRLFPASCRRPGRSGAAFPVPVNGHGVRETLLYACPAGGMRCFFDMPMSCSQLAAVAEGAAETLLLLCGEASSMPREHQLNRRTHVKEKKSNQ